MSESISVFQDILSKIELLLEMKNLEQCKLAILELEDKISNSLNTNEEVLRKLFELKNHLSHEYFEFAQVEISHNQFETAFSYYLESNHLQTFSVDRFSKCCNIMYENERWDYCLELCKSAISSGNLLIEFYFMMISSYLSLNHHKEAYDVINKISNSFNFDLVSENTRIDVITKSKSFGDNKFKAKDYEGAICGYSIGIKVDSINHVLYSNRSACYQAIKRWNEAFEDGLKTIELNPTFFKGYLHATRSLIQLQRFNVANEILVKAEMNLSHLDNWASELKRQFEDISRSITNMIAANKTLRDNKNRAETLKVNGNSYYQSGDYRQAIKLYSQAISLVPTDGLLYGNRAACWIMLQEYNQAIADCSKGVEYEASVGELDKLRVRHITALTHIGKFEEAIAIISMLSKENRNFSVFQEKLDSLNSIKLNVTTAETALGNSEFSRSLRLLQKVQSAGVSDCPKVLLMMAKSYFGVKDYENASSTSQKAISIAANRNDANNIELYVVKADTLVAQGQLEQAIKFYSAALQLDPDNSSVVRKFKHLKKMINEIARIKQLISESSLSSNFDDVIEYCSDGLKIEGLCDKILSELYQLRSKAYLSLGQLQKQNDNLSKDDSLNNINFKKSLQDISKCFYYNKSSEVFLLKIEILQAMSNHSDAVFELEQYIEENKIKDDEFHEHLRKAKLLLKRSNRKDLYATLNLPQGSKATEEDIRKAYKKSALKWHPDRHASSTEDQKFEATAKFKEINTAFEILTDANKRKLYDEGYDIDDIEQQMEYEKQGGRHSHRNPYGDFF